MQNLKKTKSLTAKEAEKGYSIDELSEAFNTYWKGKDWKKKGSGFKPYKRWENFWKYQVDSQGYLPTAAELLQSFKNKQASKLVPNPTANWTAIGPFNPGTLGGSLPGTGRINAMAVDPNNPDIWYAGAPSGGIWKSTDAGSTWTNLFDEFLQIGVSGIAIDPNDSNIIYIATGDDDAANSFSVGVFKSIDGGASWAETTLGPSSDPNWGNNRLMSEIAIDPTDSNTIWVATSFGLYKSIDAGASWDRKRVGNITDFRLKPGDSNTVYAITDSRFFKSTNGEDFNEITDILPSASGRRVIDVTPANPDVVYILTAKIQSEGYEYQGLYKSTDSGETFAESPNTVNIMESSQAWFDLALAVSPTDENELYMGCLNIWRSDNGGDTFTRLNQWFRNDAAYAHADIHTLKFFNGILYAGTDGGLYITENGGAAFTDKTGNMAVTQFYRLSVARNNSNRLAGGTQDNAGYVANGTEWNVYTGGDGMDYEIDPNNEDIIYGFVQFGDPLFITNNAGESAGQVAAPAGETGNWITPLAVNSLGEVFAGYDRAVYKLVGNAWEKWSNDFGSNNLDDIEVYLNDPNIMYVADEDFVYRSNDGGRTFSAFNRFDSQVSDIAVNGTDDSFIYVTTSERVGTSEAGQTADRGVFRVPVNASGDAGPEEDITLNLPTDQSYFSIVHQGRHSQNPIYVGTSLGIYRLDDSLTEWEEYFEGLPNTAVSDLEITLDDEIITASTYGRGAFQSPIPVEVPDNDVRLLSISPTTTDVLCSEIFPQVQIENKGLNPITEVVITYSLNSGSEQNITWTGNLASENTSLVDLPSLAGQTIIGQNSLNVELEIIGDSFADNNSGTTSFIVNQFAVGDDVFDFESEAEALITFNETDSGNVWERGVPTGTLLNTASSGTQVYGTNLDGDHPANTKGIILSGCYELSSIVAPVLKFQMAYDLEQNFDIIYVEYTLDDGATWNLLGGIDSQPNWYTSNRTNASSGDSDDCQNCPGGQWTGTNATMTEYAYDFVANANAGETDLTTESNVIFRIVFQSDPGVEQEGAIVDDFVVEGVQDDDDDDNDGILDVDDNCPLTANADQADNDGDGDGDVCDNDDDNDGILDTEDNCPFTANPDQEDADGDGIGDVCDNDADNDGVPNANDLCPDTPENSTVDVDGCPIFTLPTTNFRIQTVDASCVGNTNGAINISAEMTMDYIATLTGEGVDTNNSFTDTTSFTNLAAGNYQVCFTVVGQTDFEVCSQLSISQPEPLSVSSKISSLDNTLELDLKGGVSYTIILNDVTYTTSDSKISLPLSKIENTLLVKTDLDCQGTYSETIVLSDELFIYPNPISSGYLNIFVGDTTSDKVEVSLFTSTGKSVMHKKIERQESTMRLSVDGLPSGFYLLNVKSENSLKSYKIIKR
ncbi:T9SS type A sorting domain-containing protein [Muricauda sp. DJ-13]|uniref:T9SS type A sorting domain-containing protein n=2 Tax=Croceivirga thetidis TaxID=2721623 RepID=A0ABX1GSG4_9FLAO|nr:T9SS type A sorting domain-containing protein [Croceivirga thetidis]